jgi:hypothetical protein
MVSVGIAAAISGTFVRHGLVVAVRRACPRLLIVDE